MTTFLTAIVILLSLILILLVVLIRIITSGRLHFDVIEGTTEKIDLDEREAVKAIKRLEEEQ